MAIKSKVQEIINEEAVKKANELLGAINTITQGHEMYLIKEVMYKSTPWFQDITTYPATPEDSIKNFSKYNITAEYRCQLSRTGLGNWCAFVYLPEIHPDFFATSLSLNITCYNQLVKCADGVFGFICNSSTDLIPVSNYKNWPSMKSKASYKKYEFVCREIKELAKKFYDRDTIIQPKISVIIDAGDEK
jgi:hypothetical protein